MTDEHIVPEVRERIARLEVKLDYVISHMSSLPPSPETITRLDKITERLEEHHTFIDNLKAKLAIVGAGFILFGSVATYGVKWALEHITVGWGN